MRLPVNQPILPVRKGLGLILLTAALAGCSSLTGGEPPATARATNGPEADFPMVLGEPYSIDGVDYKPANSWNYDEVGYVGRDNGLGITATHRTLPLPSYVEVTSLESGKTILVRIERRGPKDTNARLIAISGEALAQLGAGDASPIRVRRVNPPESERAALRAGQAAPERMKTPASLVTVLRKGLPDSGPKSLAVRTRPQRISVTPAQRPARQNNAEGKFVVQAAAFSNATNAQRAAKALGGFIEKSGGYHRVRTGPYTNRGQAEAALAKVRAAGYTDARVMTTG